MAEMFGSGQEKPMKMGKMTQAPSEFANPKNYPSREAMKKAGDEMKSNPPSILAKTKKKSGAKQAKKQAVAIMLSKARRGK